MKNEPVCRVMCATCPFRPGSPHANLQSYLTEQALNISSRYCHSTGNSVFYGKTGKKLKICRGTRDIQLKVMFAMRVIDAPTDEAWKQKAKTLHFKEQP